MPRASTSAPPPGVRITVQETGPLHIAPPLERSGRGEFTDAIMLTGMTFACTALAVYDLFLLATGL